MTDFGFQGHPLRKDFPVTGYEEIRYDDNLQRCVWEPIEITQELRGFDYLNPWYKEHGSSFRQRLPGDLNIMFSYKLGESNVVKIVIF